MNDILKIIIMIITIISTLLVGTKGKISTNNISNEFENSSIFCEGISQFQAEEIANIIKEQFNGVKVTAIRLVMPDGSSYVQNDKYSPQIHISIDSSQSLDNNSLNNMIQVIAQTLPDIESSNIAIIMLQ